MISRLTKHIHRILAEHACVVVPGVGGFMLELQPAHIDRGACLLYPTSTELCFNELLQHQDGLLAQSYAEEYAISLRRARLLLEEDVRTLRNSLVHRRRVSLDELGTLSLNEDGHIVFEPQVLQTFQGISYGLSPLSLANTSVKTTEQLAQTDHPDYLTVRLSKRSLSWGAAAVICLLALLPWGRSVQLEHRYTASIAPTELAIDKVLETVTAEKATDVENEPSGSWIEPVAGRYYIIIATERQAERAEAHCEQAKTWSADMPICHLGILQDSRVYRVSLAQFDLASEAYNYLTELNKRGKQGWVYQAK